jgi:hypothetical protein
MKKYQGIPELLEAYMKENAVDEMWITAHELRDHFGLTRYQSNTVSAFLRRLEFGPFRQYPFIVAKIAQEGGKNPSDPKKSRYLLQLRVGASAPQRQTWLQDLTIREPVPAFSSGNMERPV